MARVVTYSIEVTSQITLSKRELQLLHHMCSYGTQTYKGLESSHYAGGVSLEELEKFIHHIRDITGALMSHVEDDKKVLFQNP